MKKIVFEKNYTRDVTLIIQQGWIYAFKIGLENELGIKNLFSPFVIDYLSEGTIEIWENAEGVRWVKDKLIEKCKKERNSIIKILVKHRRGLKELKPVWKRGYARNKVEFFEFIDKIYDLMTGNLVFCYLAIDKRTPLKIKKIAVNLRTHDKFFVKNDMVIRKSIRKLFPSLTGYETCIRVEEIKNRMPNKNECKKRMRHFIMTSGGYYRVQKLDDYIKSNPGFIFKKEAFSKTSIIEGRIAYRGIVRGKVRVIKSIIQMSKVKRGDILVSPMTTALFVPAMKKAGAIVTDEGGIICHAAIIAKELKKPCIVGTKIATKVLKDGDLVEVDAERGVVKKL